MPKKLYCYVDETWLNPPEELFIVSVITADSEKEAFRDVCEEIERKSGKERVKWAKAGHTQRVNYIQRVLRHPRFAGRLFFSRYPGNPDHQETTIKAIVDVIAYSGCEKADNTVVIDALSKSLEHEVGNELHRAGVRTKKVRGMRKDENDALIRLADALCGLVRGALIGQADMQELLKVALAAGVVLDLSQD
jgi:hypothetical protein